MRIHWELKLQIHTPSKCTGDFLFRDREAFSEYLIRASNPERAALCEKWNGIDFSRQMAVLVLEEHSTGGYGVRILGIWKCATEILVEILDQVPGPGGAVTEAFSYPIASAVVNRSPLPVRFLRRTTSP